MVFQHLRHALLLAAIFVQNHVTSQTVMMTLGSNGRLSMVESGRFVMIIYGNMLREGAGVLVSIHQGTIPSSLHMNIAANAVYMAMHAHQPALLHPHQYNTETQ